MTHYLAQSDRRIATDQAISLLPLNARFEIAPTTVKLEL
jgi:hypothetical protein